MKSPPHQAEAGALIHARALLESVVGYAWLFRMAGHSDLTALSPFTTGNRGLGTNLLGFCVRRGLGALKLLLKPLFGAKMT